MQRHIDGANVDGSLVLGLPTYEPYEGGGLTVWDGENEREEFVYPVGVGDACMLDSRVWHQSNPIREVRGGGERWVIVIFYQVLTTKPERPGGATKAPAAARSQAVRELLARRVVEAKRRKELTEEAQPTTRVEAPAEALRGPAAWDNAA